MQTGCDRPSSYSIESSPVCWGSLWCQPEESLLIEPGVRAVPWPRQADSRGDPEQNPVLRASASRPRQLAIKCGCGIFLAMPLSMALPSWHV